MSEQTFRIEDGGELGTDPPDVEQHRCWRRRVHLFLGHKRVTLGLQRSDLLEQQFEPAERATDLCFQMLRQHPTIAGTQFL